MLSQTCFMLFHEQYSNVLFILCAFNFSIRPIPQPQDVTCPILIRIFHICIIAHNKKTPKNRRFLLFFLEINTHLRKKLIPGHSQICYQLSTSYYMIESNNQYKFQHNILHLSLHDVFLFEFQAVHVGLLMF